jgi:hypothetical protein
MDSYNCLVSIGMCDYNNYKFMIIYNVIQYGLRL